jgi:hypothetical protein
MRSFLDKNEDNHALQGEKEKVEMTNEAAKLNQISVDRIRSTRRVEILCLCYDPNTQ